LERESERGVSVSCSLGVGSLTPSSFFLKSYHALKNDDFKNAIFIFYNSKGFFKDIFLLIASYYVFALFLKFLFTAFFYINQPL